MGEFKKATDPNSMYVWLPVVKNLRLPHPRTEMVYCGWRKMSEMIDGKRLSNEQEILSAAARIGYPLFLRSDLASGKHNWDDTCFVSGPDVLLHHVHAVIEFNLTVGIVGLDCVGLALREYIELDSSFRAFQGMPVARERRYFAGQGNVRCHHPYWIEDAIANYGTAHKPMLPPDWRQRLVALNEEGAEVKQLSKWAASVSQQLEGEWSIDFAHTKDKGWLLIDMALGAESWHPDCQFKEQADG